MMATRRCTYTILWILYCISFLLLLLFCLIFVRDCNLLQQLHCIIHTFLSCATSKTNFFLFIYFLHFALFSFKRYMWTIVTRFLVYITILIISPYILIRFNIVVGFVAISHIRNLVKKKNYLSLCFTMERRAACISFNTPIQLYIRV